VSESKDHVTEKSQEVQTSTRSIESVNEQLESPDFEEGNGNSLQYSCLENPMGRGAWQATVHGVKNKSRHKSRHKGLTHKQTI